MNYGEIKTAVSGVLMRSDLSSSYDTFLAQTEADIRADVRVPSMEATATLTLSSRTVAVPTGFLAVRRIVMNSSTSAALDYLPPDRLYSSSIYHDSGDVAAYTIEGGNFVFAPAPANSPEALLHYWKAPTAFSADSDNNAISNEFPQIYIYGMLVYAGILIDEARTETWLGAYRGAVNRANETARRGRSGTRLMRTGHAAP